MIFEPEFVRGNQRSYIRIACSEEVFESYEYQMCNYNTLKSVLDFQHRSQNGENYLYYEVSGMQSLDVFLETQKLKRNFAEILLKAIVKLCKELSEFALDISSVVFFPKFVMVDSDGEEVKFIYSFRENKSENEEIEKLLECCIEYLDYKDEELMRQFYKIYENLLDKNEQFGLCKEMEQILSLLSEEQKENSTENIGVVHEVVPFEESVNEVSVKIPIKSKTAENEFKGLKRGTIVLFLANIAVLFFWKPLTLLKIFFCVALGGVLFVLNILIYKKEKKYKEVEEEKRELEVSKEAYDAFYKNFGIDNNDGTQIITIRDTERFLYSVQNIEPQYIYFSDTKKIVGKDVKRAQVCIPQGGVSRVHALLLREDSEYMVEDLNSTNGTWVNGKALIPREPYSLKEGDRGRFAEMEYIFR